MASPDEDDDDDDDNFIVDDDEDEKPKKKRAAPKKAPAARASKAKPAKEKVEEPESKEPPPKKFKCVVRAIPHFVLSVDILIQLGGEESGAGGRPGRSRLEGGTRRCPRRAGGPVLRVHGRAQQLFARRSK